jgi:hypothetical protein
MCLHPGRNREAREGVARDWEFLKKGGWAGGRLRLGPRLVQCTGCRAFGL